MLLFWLNWNIVWLNQYNEKMAIEIMDRQKALHNYHSGLCTSLHVY